VNRNVIKKFATWARMHLREQITAKAARFGITAKGTETPQFISGGMTVAGFTYDAQTTALYQQLVNDLNEKRRRGLSDKAVLDALVDEMAYTWFNRLTALRFMEVKGYTLHALSSSTEGLVDPDLLQNATTLISGDEFTGVTLDDLDNWRKGGDEVVYRNLLVAHCRKLAEPLPFLFGESKSYAALFLPDNLLTTGSVIRRIVSDIPVEDWQDIEIIGWLYQFYISERKDEIFAKGGAYDARDIPAATQLFTPHWIVRYMVENSLGRLWLEAHPESNLRSQMPYYLESEGQGEPVTPNLELKPEDLSVLDPACGSGHILVYAFDLLFAIYQEQGYPEPSIAALILEHNLHGLEIDERAAQLASFALMMKGREKSRRTLRNPPALHVTHTAPTRGWTLPDVPELEREDWRPLLDAFQDADNLGSLITPPAVDLNRLEGQLAAFEASSRQEVSGDAPRLRALLKQAALLSKKYRAVVANPPYMGGKAFSKAVKDFVLKNYPRSKSDLFATFIERIEEMTYAQGYAGMVTMQSWMFLSSYEALREHLLTNHTIVSLLHMDNMVMRIAFSTSAFILAKRYDPDLKGVYTWLELGNLDATGEAPKAFPAVNERNSKAQDGLFHASAHDFEKIPGSPIAYWVSERVLEVFESHGTISQYGEPREGMAIGSNDAFMRHWYEPAFRHLGFGYDSSATALQSGKKWFPYNKGGQFRRWFGNNFFVVDWQNDGYAIRNFASDTGRIRSHNYNLDFIFRKCLTWTDLGTNTPFALRYSPQGFIFDSSGKCLFLKDSSYLASIFAYLNSSVAKVIFPAINPSFHFQPGDVAVFPFSFSEAENGFAQSISERTIAVSKTDWDNFETSWDFQTHPLLRMPHPRLAAAFNEWQETADAAFYELKRLEEENNRYWIDAYGLQDELTPDVPDEQITIRRANLSRDIKSLISYAVGCMMGRYSLDTPGLQFAGGTFDPSAFSGSFLPDNDGILPFTDEAYFEDDIVSRFVDFLRAAYGPEYLEENLTFVADALTRKGGESAVARIRRYFVSEFISDHIQTYKKRPIYWLFTSGKGRAFGALVYLHRYTPDTLSYLRNNYVLPLQSKLEAEITSTERALEVASSASAAKAAQKTLLKLREQVAELLLFHDRLLHKADQRIDIDLDDGVAYNYTLFDGLLYTGADMKLADLMKKSEWKRELLAQAQKVIVVNATT
jgi:hypothetical protein